jgi:hypothetical protein
MHRLPGDRDGLAARIDLVQRAQQVLPARSGHGGGDPRATPEVGRLFPKVARCRYRPTA